MRFYTVSDFFQRLFQGGANPLDAGDEFQCKNIETATPKRQPSIPKRSLSP